MSKRRQNGRATPSAPPAANAAQVTRGELALIQQIRRRAAKLRPGSGGELRLGIGDDCAILRPRRSEEIVVTTDFTLEGRHFRRDWHPAPSAGHRALARGLSDLAAMGARPVAAFLSLALPAEAASDGWVEGFLDGLFALAETARVPLAGGDLSEAPGGFALADIVLLGAVPAGEALRRDGARPGDRLFCTGYLGGAAAELQQLASAATSDSAAGRDFQPAANPHPQLYPTPRLAAGAALRRRGLAGAAIDLSDGLSTDLRHLCQASSVAAEVDAARLPLHPLAAAQPPGVALRLALNGGEDYELVFTAPAGIRIPSRIGGVPLTEIGRITRPIKGKPLVSLRDAHGRSSELVAGGWEHLR